MNRLPTIITILIAGIGGYFIYAAIVALNTTGLLTVAGPSGALLTLMEADHRPTNIGTSSAKVRVVPGKYELFATKDKIQTSKTVEVIKRGTTAVSLSLPTTASSSGAQSPASVKTDLTNRLIKSLPYLGPASQYEINYSYTYTASVAQPVIIISGPDKASQQAALQWIIAKGFDPSQLNIQYQTVAIQSHNYTNGAPGGNP